MTTRTLRLAKKPVTSVEKYDCRDIFVGGSLEKYYQVTLSCFSLTGLPRSQGSVDGRLEGARLRAPLAAIFFP